MIVTKTVSSTILLILSFLGGFAIAATASAADISARLSTREAYVGMPITLQIAIVDADSYQQPSIPDIDGCDIRSAGSPSQSSQITIINGRRSETRSVTMQYLITPRREGTFEIPSFTIQVDGRNLSTEPLQFVATKSQTGDLLFVEISGSKKKVFVGQPLDLTLKIWIKPFSDPDRSIKLSEGDMWRMISQHSSWGSFTDRIQELSTNNQRPAGREVLRDDGQGTRRAYYLYEIDGTLYPTHPGRIDVDDIQIIVNYPTALGRSRSRFGSLFDGPLGHDPFGGNSPLSRMMKDDFFGDRLAVTSARPIIGEVSVDATEVIPVPVVGRPADYRGAVGRYQIVTQATPTIVDAGDPITLNIGIAGTGPMELVQAPPLSEMPALVADFKIADQSLAGFVQDETKLFSTSIRPRRSGINEIPPISFSFFDPETERFETVVSDPIPITVNEAEALALDAIVGNSKAGNPASFAVANESHAPDFSNSAAASLLISQTPPTQNLWLWMWVVVPPILWAAIFLIRYGIQLASRLPALNPAYKCCRNAIGRANDRPAMADALTQYISRRSGVDCPTPISAVGVLRASGMYDLACQVESFFQASDRSLYGYGGVAQPSTSDCQQEAYGLADRLRVAFASLKKSRVRSSRGGARPAVADIARTGAITQRSVMLLAATVALAAGSARASDPMVNFTAAQKQTILDEASEAYARASGMAQSESADAKELFATAARKYQLLVDSGIRNSELSMNLGNAYMQCGELGRAIVNYERARRLDPSNPQLLVNLQFAHSRVKSKSAEANSSPADATSLQLLKQRLLAANTAFISAVGVRSITGALAISSLLFWGILIVRALGWRFRAWRFAFAPLLILIISLSSFVLLHIGANDRNSGVIVATHLQLRAGDGELFDEVLSLDSSEGQRVEVLSNRGNWIKIRTSEGETGWIKDKHIERIGG